jgi:twitching motility protein PilT
MELEGLLQTVVRDGASDLILKIGSFPAMRLLGRVRFIADEKITPQFALGVLQRLLRKEATESLETVGATDVPLELPEIGRFRVNIFRQSGRPSFVFRHVKREIPSFQELHLPVAPLKRLATLRRGLVLSTGVAGSGKSTTMAAMIEHINQTESRHVVTIEDPIEFIFEDRLSVISQREVGVDCPSFASALKHAVRQAPDVIFLGEMRDRETIESGIHAAETGHLVLSTLHTVNAVQTVERMILHFPPHEHALIRQQLSLNLAGVVSLRLVPAENGQGLYPAVELLLATPAVKDILNEGRTRDLPHALAEGDYWGTMTFNQSLRRLVETGNVTVEAALEASDSPEELKLQLRGINPGGKLTNEMPPPSAPRRRETAAARRREY